MNSRAPRPWLEGPSAALVGDAVRSVAPHLSGEVHLNDMRLSSKPFWQRGTAWIGDGHVVKFAWSQAAAAELDRERRVVGALADTPFRRWMPPIEATSEQPLLIITRRVDGAPGTSASAVAEGVAEALATLHEPAVRTSVIQAVTDVPSPTPQADTDAIRGRLPSFVDAAYTPQIQRWCDWVDEVQADRAGERVLLHGDVHRYNLLVDEGRLQCVLDYGEVAVGDHHFDFRYLPAVEPTIGFFCRTAESYERRSGRAVEPAPVLAWHIRTVLGDALWRTEAGVPLPDGGTVEGWIEGMAERIVQLAAWRSFDAPGE